MLTLKDLCHTTPPTHTTPTYTTHTHTDIETLKSVCLCVTLYTEDKSNAKHTHTHRQTSTQTHRHTGPKSTRPLDMSFGGEVGGGREEKDFCDEMVLCGDV
jgi:hypothetical protein